MYLDNSLTTRGQTLKYRDILLTTFLLTLTYPGGIMMAYQVRRYINGY